MNDKPREICMNCKSWQRKYHAYGIHTGVCSFRNRGMPCGALFSCTNFKHGYSKIVKENTKQSLHQRI